MTYAPQLYPRRDSIGNVRQVGVVHDADAGCYVGVIRGGRPYTTVHGTIAQYIVTAGEGATPDAAADAAISAYNARDWVNR